MAFYSDDGNWMWNDQTEAWIPVPPTSNAPQVQADDNGSNTTFDSDMQILLHEIPDLCGAIFSFLVSKVKTPLPYMGIHFHYSSESTMDEQDAKEVYEILKLVDRLVRRKHKVGFPQDIESHLYLTLSTAAYNCTASSMSETHSRFHFDFVDYSIKNLKRAVSMENDNWAAQRSLESLGDIIHQETQTRLDYYRQARERFDDQDVNSMRLDLKIANLIIEEFDWYELIPEAVSLLENIIDTTIWWIDQDHHMDYINDLRAEANYVLGIYYGQQYGDPSAELYAGEYVETCLSMYREIGDPYKLGWALFHSSNWKDGNWKVRAREGIELLLNNGFDVQEEMQDMVKD